MRRTKSLVGFLYDNAKPLRMTDFHNKCFAHLHNTKRYTNVTRRPTSLMKLNCKIVGRTPHKYAKCHCSITAKRLQSDVGPRSSQASTGLCNLPQAWVVRAREDQNSLMLQWRSIFNGETSSESTISQQAKRESTFSEPLVREVTLGYPSGRI